LGRRRATPFVEVYDSDVPEIFAQSAMTQTLKEAERAQHAVSVI
jgi:hypothetical protein